LKNPEVETWDLEQQKQKHNGSETSEKAGILGVETDLKMNKICTNKES